MIQSLYHISYYILYLIVKTVWCFRYTYTARCRWKYWCGFVVFSKTRRVTFESVKGYKILFWTLVINFYLTNRYYYCFRTESAYEDETMRPPINLPDIDLGLLFSNMTRKHHLEDVRTILLLLGRYILYPHKLSPSY